MRRALRLASLLGVVVGSVLSASLALATTYRELTLEAMLAAAEVGFYGQVAATEVEDRGGEPWTRVTFEVLTPLLGVEAGEEVTLAFYGGALPGGESVSVSLMPQFSVGELLVILAYASEHYSPIVGFRQGLWRSSGLGLADESGRLLSLDEDGALELDGEGGDGDALIAALAAALAARP